jgi:hypothetical protein
MNQSHAVKSPIPARGPAPVLASAPPPPPADPYGRQELVTGTMRKLIDQRAVAARSVVELDMRLEYLFYDLDSRKDDPQDVEKYDGTLGVTREFVNDYERPVGQLQWTDLTGKFGAPNEDPGNVSNQRWGCGALIEGADDLFLTAGHCFRQEFRSWRVPQRNGMPIPPAEIAPLMCVCFNFQIDGETGKTREEVCYPVIELVECSPSPQDPNSTVDYAIVRLGRDEKYKTLPGKMFGGLRVARTDLTMKNASLCIIQHPNRTEKKVEAGHLLEIRDGRIAYNDIGTFGGSSGAPILNGMTGEIVGVHIKGGSIPIGGFNSGTAIGAIRAKSKALTNL